MKMRKVLEIDFYHYLVPEDMNAEVLMRDFLELVPCNYDGGPLETHRRVGVSLTISPVDDEQEEASE